MAVTTTGTTIATTTPRTKPSVSNRNNTFFSRRSLSTYPRAHVEGISSSQLVRRGVVVVSPRDALEKPGAEGCETWLN